MQGIDKHLCIPWCIMYNQVIMQEDWQQVDKYDTELSVVHAVETLYLLPDIVNAFSYIFQCLHCTEISIK
jgi:hypothetical protein